MRSRLLRLAAALGGVAILTRAVDVPRAAQGLREANPLWVLLGIALTAAGVSLTVASWRVALRGMGHRFTWPQLASWHLQGLFAGHVAPSGAAGEAVRVIRVGHVAGYGAGLASLAVSRLANTTGMAIVGVAAAALLYSTYGMPILAGALALLAAMGLCWALAFRLPVAPRAGASPGTGWRRRALHFLHGSVASMAEGWQALRRVPRVSGALLLIGLVGWGINLLALQSFAHAVGVQATWTVLAVAVPTSMVAATVPMAFRGIGVREGVLIGMLAYLGIDTGHAGALAVLLDLQLLPFALAGGALLARRSRQAGRAATVERAPARQRGPRFQVRQRVILRRVRLAALLGAGLLVACGEQPASGPASLAASGSSTVSSTSQVSPSPGTSTSVSSSCSGRATPAQTEGPYFKAGSPQRTALVEPGMPGTRLQVSGRVLTLECQAVAGAVLDFWQADAAGAYDNSGYRLRGNQVTDASGGYSLDTIVPGEYPGRTRHIHVKVQVPGKKLLTSQLYFPGEARNQQDSIFDAALLMDVHDSGSGRAAVFDFQIG
jgi:uncharacterized protein (TIRG00374 family)